MSGKLNDKITLTVLTDSRGKGLSDVVGNDPQLQDLAYTNVVLSKGAKLKSLIGKADRLLSDKTSTQGPDYVIIQAGICDFTSLETTNGKRSIRYYRNRDSINYLAYRIQDIYLKFPGAINIATVPPAGIRKSIQIAGIEEKQDENLNEQQEQLLEDIQELNQAIIDCNRVTQTETIDLAAKVYSNSKKKREKRRRITFTDKGLTDGVHSNDSLTPKWHNLTVEIAKREVRKFSENREYRSHSVDEEDRCFKRRKDSKTSS